jgi:pyruvate ferredoxin oxidoreductase alpha subunit
LAALAALPVFEEVCRDFAKEFGRSYGAVEAYRMEDAEYVYFMMGSFATKAKDAVDRLREAGWRAGLLRPRLVRPWPEEVLRRWLLGRKAVMVVDQNLSMGKGGVLYAELASSLYGQTGAPLLASFIGGLGGRDISAEEFYEMAAVAHVQREEAK